MYMTSKERVKKAINFFNPDVLPMLFFNKDYYRSDIIIDNIGRNYTGRYSDVSQWGYKWGHLDSTMGQPETIVIKDWEDLDNYTTPNGFDITRFENLLNLKNKFGKDKYYLGSFELSGFTIMSFLRGFDNLMMDFALYPDEVERLADVVFTYEENVITTMADKGYDGVAFYDDWGTQSNLLISPNMWREVFKSRYKKQFELAHKVGLDVYFHSCGYIMDIIDDLLEIGVDMLNISQPNLYDIKSLGIKFRGKGCFVCPVSYQTTSITGKRKDIFHDVKEMVESLSTKDGGLIGYIEEYSSMGMSNDNYNACVEAFERYGNQV